MPFNGIDCIFLFFSYFLIIIVELVDPYSSCELLVSKVHEIFFFPVMLSGLWETILNYYLVIEILGTTIVYLTIVSCKEAQNRALDWGDSALIHSQELFFRINFRHFPISLATWFFCTRLLGRVKKMSNLKALYSHVLLILMRGITGV